MNLCDTIEFELAKILDNKIFSDFTDNKYAAENVEVTWDNYLGVGKYKEGDLIDDGDNIHGKYYYAPTYAEVIDWLFNRGIIIEFSPVYTFSLQDRIAYFYKVYKKNDEESTLNLIYKDFMWFSSFKLAMKDIIKKLIEDKYIN